MRLATDQSTARHNRGTLAVAEYHELPAAGEERTLTKQTFLVGPTIYLRPLEMADAATAPFWSDYPFPVSADVMEERLKEQVPSSSASGTRRLVACRRSDDMPMGSAEVSSSDGRVTDLSFSVPEVFGPARQTEIIAEMIRLLVPWRLLEHDQMAVRINARGNDDGIQSAANGVGMEPAYVLRAAYASNGGQRVDQVCYQALHPTWLAKLGAPPTPVFGNVERVVRSPAPLRYKRREADPPANAFLVGKRIYLKPIEQDDAEEISRWAMRETQTAFDVGRGLRSPISYWHWTRKNYQPDPPTWVRFAICSLDDGRVIGSNGLAFIDWLHKTAETETEIVQPEFRGAGYGTEAKHLLLEYAFETLDLHMVRSQAWAFNTPSCTALRKQGYRDAGRINWTGIKDGAFADDLLFDLLASEWRSARTGEA
jgi:RimJ/RimL family protein N-acetyltransferase